MDGERSTPWEPEDGSGTAANSADSGIGSSGEQSAESRKDEPIVAAKGEEEDGRTEVGAVQEEAGPSAEGGETHNQNDKSPSKSAGGGVFHSMVGFARSRLFRNPNDADTSSPSSITGGTPLLIGQQIQSLPPSSTDHSQSARATPAKKGWTSTAQLGREGSNKSCPVGRKVWTAQKGRGDSREQRGSLSWAGSRESVTEPEDSRSVAATTQTFAGDQSQYSSTGGGSRRTSWLQKNGGGEKAKEHWQLFAITLQRASQSGFGIAISGGPGSDSAILVSDVVHSGPAFGLLQVGDRIISVNGYPLEHADYGSAVAVMKDAQQLNMIVKRRVPVPFVEFEQRTLKFTLSKSRKKDDFGIVLGCKFFIKEILNPKLAEKEPGLKEGDTVLRVNGQGLDGMTLDEASRMLQRSREKLSLVVQRDVRRGAGGPGAPGGGGRWPSQTTVYERLGSVQATPRQSPTPVHYGHPMGGENGQFCRNAASTGPEGSSASTGGFKRFSDPMTGPVRAEFLPSAAGTIPHYAHPPTAPFTSVPYPPSQQPQQQQLMVMSNNGREMSAGGMSQSQQSHHSCPSPFLHQQRLTVNSSPGRPQSQTPSSVHSLNNSSLSANPMISATPDQQQQQPPFVSDQQQRYLPYHPQPPHPFAASLQQSRVPPRQIHSLAFHKGPGGLGIRVIGGNQVGIFVSAVQEHSPADQNGIRVGDRIHAVNGTSMVGVTREEAFDFLLSLGEQQICMAVERAAADEYAQIKAGKCGDSFYVRTHFAHRPERAGGGGRQQQPELAFLAGDIFHVTDTLFGGSPGCWQVTKVYSAADAEPKGGVMEPGSGIIPHAKAAETLMRKQRQAEKANGDMNGAEGGGGGTIGRTLFRKKLSLSTCKLLGKGGSAAAADQSADDVLSGGSGTGNYAADLVAPAYERVALKRPAFHRPVVLYGPLADVARQLLLSRFPLRFGAPLPSSSSATTAEPLSASTSSGADSQRGIPLAAVDAVMAAQKHCVLCVSIGSVERLQLAQYAPIVILIDVESTRRVRDLRSKAGAANQSARKLLEQAQRVKKQHQHMLTATLDASKEDQWFDALRQLIFHLQERRVWMPEFQPECPLDDVLLFPVHQPGETPTSDSGGDYGVYDGGLNGGGGQHNGTNHLFGQSAATASQNHKSHQLFLVPNPVYTLKQQQFGGALIAHHQHMSSSLGSSSAEADYISSSSRQHPAKPFSSRQSEPPPALHSVDSARNSPFGPSGTQHLSLYSSAPQQQQSSPREAKSQLLAQLATELASPGQQQRL